MMRKFLVAGFVMGQLVFDGVAAYRMHRMAVKEDFNERMVELTGIEISEYFDTLRKIGLEIKPEFYLHQEIPSHPTPKECLAAGGHWVENRGCGAGPVQ
jgi:hypothetical protein